MLEESGPLQQLLSRDAALRPDDVAEAVWQALAGDAFFVLPHPEVRDYYEQRATHPDAWLAGMNRLQQKLDHETDRTDQTSATSNSATTQENA
jgi:hypothetical protein